MLYSSKEHKDLILKHREETGYYIRRKVVELQKSVYEDGIKKIVNEEAKQRFIERLIEINNDNIVNDNYFATEESLKSLKHYVDRYIYDNERPRDKGNMFGTGDKRIDNLNLKIKRLLEDDEVKRNKYFEKYNGIRKGFLKNDDMEWLLSELKSLYKEIRKNG